MLWIITENAIGNLLMLLLDRLMLLINRSIEEVPDDAIFQRIFQFVCHAKCMPGGHKLFAL